MPKNTGSARTSKKRRPQNSDSRSNNSRGRNKNSYGSRSSGSRSGSRSKRSKFSSGKKPLDPKLFVREVEEITPEQQISITHAFEDFGFHKKLLANILHKGYENPTPIQDQTIAHALAGSDVLGMANTGTGKTAAFVLPIIDKLLKSRDQKTRALIVAPTRELAQQINEEFRSFTGGGLKLYSTMCVGGLSINKQAAQLRRRPHVVVGTPGRLKDLYKQKILDLSDISMFVLDEVDLMLDMGFIDDIKFIVDAIPKERQTFCFSATMTDAIKNVIDGVAQNPVHVSVKTGDTSGNVDQSIVYAKRGKEKWERLVNIINDETCEKALIFCETKSFVQTLSDDLNKYGIATEAIHGDKSQPQRQKALKKFKDNKVDILVATDVAARGLDIPNVSHVINYDPPRIYEDYVHRIGRTGRAGKLGTAITFVKAETKLEPSAKKKQSHSKPARARKQISNKK